MMASRGWCPSLHEPMEAGDGLLVRIKPSLGQLAHDQITRIGDAARRHGNGVIELTSRGNLQLRGLTAESVPRLAAEMVSLGLAAPEPAAERRRNVIVSPFGNLDVMAAALEDALIREDGLARLHPKFLFSVQDSGWHPDAGADIRLLHYGGAWLIGLGGSAVMGWTSDPVAAALRLAHTSCASAPVRMNTLLRRAEAGAILAAAGLPLGQKPSDPAATCIGPVAGGFLYGVPFGVFDPEIWAYLARCRAHGPLRLAGRGVFLPSLAAPALLRQDGERSGLIVAADDPRSRIQACTGAPRCRAGLADVRRHAAVFAASGFPGSLHVSGCAKSCARQGAADITLVARPDGYAMIRGGSAQDPAGLTGLSLDAALQAMEMRP